MYIGIHAWLFQKNKAVLWKMCLVYQNNGLQAGWLLIYWTYEEPRFIGFMFETKERYQNSYDRGFNNAI